MDDDLTVDEILAIYNLGIGADLTSDSGDYVSSSNLELFYDFNEDSTTIDDKTGNSAQDGVLEGGTFVGRSSITDSKIIPTSTLSNMEETIGISAYLLVWAILTIKSFDLAQSLRVAINNGDTVRPIAKTFTSFLYYSWIAFYANTFMV